MTESQHPPIILEIAAALLVPAGIVGFSRVFDTSDALTPLIGAALLSSALAVLLRRLRLPLSLSSVASAVALMVLIINRFAAGTAILGLIPTAATQAQFQALIDDLVLNFQELKSPVPALDAFVATAMVGAWVMAFLTDWGALRLRLAFEPVLPAALLFLFAAILGSGQNQVLTAVIFGVAVAFWAVTQRSVNLARNNTWLADDRQRGAFGVAQAGAVVAALALIVGVIVGPRLPGAEAEELVSLRDSGDPTRVVVSPFVNIESRLVSQTATELFTVASEQPAYWRLAGLDTYDDNIWKVAGNFSPQDGELPGQGVQGGQREPVLQDFSISALDAIWLPAAFTPSEIRSADARVTWNADTSSLTVANDVQTSDGVNYQIESVVPRFTRDELRAASPFVPPDIAEAYLTLPSIPDLVRTEAERVTAAETSNYDKMVALQEYFRGFDYSVNLSPRVGDPLEQFLLERIGFCQQFAGTFAVMARSLGIPARVAIGFTWGDPIGSAEDGRTIYSVTGRQAHAWPEVWFDGLGWVAFEPTPGRGAPNSANYTDVAAQQDSLIQPDNPDNPVTTTTAPQTPAENVGEEPTAQIPDVPINNDDSAFGVGSGGFISLGLALRLLAGAAVVGAYLGGPLLYRELKRQRRRQAVVTPADGVETAWAEVAETLDLGYGLQRRPAETRREYARRLGQDMRVPHEPMQGLAEKATVARYHPGGLGPDDATAADQLASQIESEVFQRVPFTTRWRRLVDPRRLLRPQARLKVSPTTMASDDTKEPATAGSNGHR
ncbi:MAG: DUF3488 and transglutaminase-like domain-containing protein [Actinomycetota bacterium]